MTSDDWVPLRVLGMFTRRSGDTMLLESYTDAYQINATGAYIWSQIGRGGTVGSIIDSVARRYELDPDLAGKAVRSFLEVLLERGFVVADLHRTGKDPQI